MSGSFVFVGRIGRDAEVRSTPSGESVVSLSLAYNYGRKGADGRRPTQWVEVTAWGQTGSAVAEYLTTGREVFCVTENVHMQEFKKRDGSPAYKLAATAIRIQLVGGRGDAQQQSGQAGQAREREQIAAPVPAPRPATRPAAPAGSGFDDMDDDIPF